MSANSPTKPLKSFSINVDDQESSLHKLTTEELDSIFGENRYQVARSIEELSRQVGIGRIGQEVFPLVIAFLFILFWSEHLVANRFYEQDQQVPVIKS